MKPGMNGQSHKDPYGAESRDHPCDVAIDDEEKNDNDDGEYYVWHPKELWHI